MVLLVTIKNLTTKENIAPVSLHRAYKERETYEFKILYEEQMQWL